MTNSELLQQIIKLKSYVRWPSDSLHPRVQSFAEPSYFFWNGSLEISAGAEKGIEHSWDESYHNGDPYNFQKRDLTSEEIEKKLKEIYADVHNKALKQAEQEALRDLATKKLWQLGLITIAGNSAR